LHDYIDYQEAFYRASNNNLIQFLTKYNVPSEATRLVLKLYWSQTTQTTGRSEDY